MHYRDFDLKLSGDEHQGYFVELLDSPLSLRSNPSPLRLPESEIWKWSEMVKTGEAGRDLCKAFGISLFQALFPQPIRDAWMRSQEKLSPQSFLRLRLDIRTPSLAAIPWEIVHDGEYHLAMVPSRPIVRYLYDHAAVDSIEGSKPLRILMAVAAHSTPQRLDATDSEIEFINSSFRELVKTGQVEAPFTLSPATLDGLQREILQGYHVLHFMGHGKFTGDVGHLILEDGDGGPHEIDGETFSYFLLGTDLRLLVLNACDTVNPAQLDPMLGIAHAAVTAGVPAVVAMQGPVYDENAAVFARAFYHALASGRPLETCMTEGRKAVMGFSSLDHSDWAIPVLFSNSLGGLLWRAPEIPPVSQPVADISFTPTSSGVTRGPAPVTDSLRAKSGRRKVPHNLSSADYAKFLDREQESKRIMDALDPGERVALVNIFGVGGVGRSTLAHEIAQRCWEFSCDNVDDPGAFDGIVWASGQRAAPTPQGALPAQTSSFSNMDDLCLTVGKALHDKILVQASLEERLAVMDDVLREGRYLLILDDADELKDGRLYYFLRNIPIPTKVIVISHSPLETGGVLIPLSSFDTETATQLLRQDALMSEVTAVEDASQEELHRLVELTDALPFVLRWCVAQLRDSGQPLSWILERLRHADNQPLVDYCLVRSISDLALQQRRLLQSFALFPQPTHIELAGEAAGLDGVELKRALARLLQLRLIRLDTTSQQYRLIFMARQYMQQDLESDHSLKREMTDRGIRRMYSLADPSTASGDGENHETLETEIVNVMWAAEQAYGLQQWQTVLDFLEVLKDFLSDRGYWNESIQLGHWAYRAAQELSRTEEGAWCTIYPLAKMHFNQGGYDEAQGWSERGLKLFRDMGNDYGMAAAERILGRVFLAKNDLDSAERLFRDGLDKARRFNTHNRDINQQADLLSSLAGLAEIREQWDEAQKGYLEALALFRKTGNSKGIVAMLHRLGSVALAQDQYDEAERLLRESLSLLKGTRAANREPKIIFTLALLHEERGRLSEAQKLLTQARQTFQNLSAAADLARTDAALTRVAAMITYQDRQKHES